MGHEMDLGGERRRGLDVVRNGMGRRGGWAGLRHCQKSLEAGAGLYRKLLGEGRQGTGQDLKMAWKGEAGAN